MAQQGSPPRRPSRQPDSEHRGRGDRPPRPGRAERPDLGSRQGYETFGPDTDADLPPWAAPSSYQERPGGFRPHPPGQRGGVKDRYAGQYGDPYAANADRGRHEGGAAYSGGGYSDPGYDDPDHAGERYQGRRRGPGTLIGDDEDVRGGSYEPAEADGEPDAPGPGRGTSRRKGRAAATRLRKSRRRVYRWAGIAIVIVLLAGGGVWIFGRSTPAPTLWVTQLLAGEYKSVPNTCAAVNTSVLDAYLPKSGRTQRVSVGSGTDSQCSYTFDKQPTFLVLEITAEALQPFAAAGNNGSATANAQLAFATARQALARPAEEVSPAPGDDYFGGRARAAGFGRHPARARQRDRNRRGHDLDQATERLDHGVMLRAGIRPWVRTGVRRHADGMREVDGSQRAGQGRERANGLTDGPGLGLGGIRLGYRAPAGLRYRDAGRDRGPA